MTDAATITPDRLMAVIEPDTGWVLVDAVALCTAIEAICPQFGCHVGLTGGVLYKEAPRKDLDILFYRIRQVEEIDKDGLFTALAAIGVEHERGFGWCHKALYRGRKIDCFFPDEDGEYPPREAAAPFAPDRLDPDDNLIDDGRDDEWVF